MLYSAVSKKSSGGNEYSNPFFLIKDLFAVCLLLYAVAEFWRQHTLRTIAMNISLSLQTKIELSAGPIGIHKIIQIG